MFKIFRITIMALLMLSTVSLANAAKMQYIGDWSTTSTYPVGDVVLYNKAVYYSLKSSRSGPNKSKIPDSQPLWWKQLGTVGNTVHSGTDAPISSIGNVGDFYIDTAQNKMYGPKTASGWPVANISLVGPQGLKGDTGPQGDTGATGPQGLKGLTGDTGATGPQGPIGLTGAKGETGAIGPVGPSGATGLQGIQGPSGVKGDKGETGATGPAGISYYEAVEGDPCTHPTSEYEMLDVLEKVIDENGPIPGQTEYLRCRKLSGPIYNLDFEGETMSYINGPHIIVDRYTWIQPDFKKNGNSSLSINARGMFLTDPDLDLRDLSFIISFWARDYATEIPSQYLLEAGMSGSEFDYSSAFKLILVDGGYLQLHAQPCSNEWLKSVAIVTENNWHKIEILRNNEQITLLIDSVSQGSVLCPVNSKFDLRNMRVGNSVFGAHGFQGYIDDFIVSVINY